MKMLLIEVGEPLQYFFSDPVIHLSHTALKDMESRFSHWEVYGLEISIKTFIISAATSSYVRARAPAPNTRFPLRVKV
jgi:hypothetical protein